MVFNLDFISFLFDYHAPTTDRQREIHSQITQGAAQLREELSEIEGRVVAGAPDAGSRAFDGVRDATKNYACLLNCCVPEGDPLDVQSLAQGVSEAIDMVAAARMFANRGVQLAAKGDVGGARRCFEVARTEVERAEMCMNRLIACYCAALELDRQAELEEADGAPAGEQAPAPVTTVAEGGALEADGLQKPWSRK